MTFLQRTTDAKRLRHWNIDMSVDYIYTSGIAGEKFFTALRDEGRVLAVHCPVCRNNQLPPRPFCEGCFTPLDQYVDVPAEGKVAAFTVSRLDHRGKPLAHPDVIAFVTFKGIQEGGLIHRLLVAPEAAKTGMRVRLKLKPKEARSGNILDIEGFEPAASQA